SLWQAVHKWQQMEGMYNSIPFVHLKREAIERDLSSVHAKESEILVKNAKNAVAKHMMEKIEKYHKMLPLILALASPAIKPRHWSTLFEAVGQHYDEDTAFTLSQLREYNILT